MANSQSKGRFTTALLAIVLVFLILSLVLAGVFLYRSYKTHHPSSASAYAKEPQVVGTLSPASYKFQTFLPVWGEGNIVGPVQYGDNLVLAGNLQDGNTVIALVSAQGAANWEVDLGGKLIACSRTLADGKQLPCLYHAPDGNGVALIDLSTGVSRWIWLSSDSYINVGVNKRNEIVLVANDLTVTKIDVNGTLLEEPLLAQKIEDKSLFTDTEKCNLDAQNYLNPENFKLLSKGFWLVTHKAINYFLNSDTGQLAAALPGVVSEDTGNEERYTLSAVPGCSNGAVIYPDRRNIAVLNNGSFMPGSLDDTVPSYLIRNGHLYFADKKNQVAGKQVFATVKLNLDANTKLLRKNDKLFVITGNRIDALDAKNQTYLWGFSDNFKQVVSAGNVLIYSTDLGEVKAVSVGEGAELWSVKPRIKDADLSLDNSRLRLAGLSGVAYYSFGEKEATNQFRGAATTIAKSQPGLDFEVDSCVRVQKVKGSNLKYSAYVTRVQCKLQGAETVNAAVPAATLPRNTSPEKLLAECNKTKDTASAITVTSRIANQNLSAICTKQ